MRSLRKPTLAAGEERPGFQRKHWHLLSVLQEVCSQPHYRHLNLFSDVLQVTNPRRTEVTSTMSAGRPRDALSARDLSALGRAYLQANGGTMCRWSGVERAERARRRHGEEAAPQDAANPCPSVIDPITLEPVVTPAISPYGHVMGLATWNAVLAEQGKCPFTQQPLRRDQVSCSPA